MECKKDEKIKAVAFYLPQFHHIPENDRAWGEGFTEWINVKKAQSYYKNHRQPRIPLNKNYYNLLEDKTLEWQVKLANKAGLFGFCFYHYWFNGKQVLEKPVNRFLERKDLDINFCLSWANEAWTKTWNGAGGDKEVLIKQSYGNSEDWDKHFEYFLEFFKDQRYIKIENKPVLLVYKIDDIIPKHNDMIERWNELAVENGFDGVFIMCMKTYDNKFQKSKFINGTVGFEPNRTRRNHQGMEKVDQLRIKILEKEKGFTLFNRFLCRVVDYDKVNKESIMHNCKKNEFRGAFVDYDDSPRRGIKGVITKGSTPKKFGNYLSQMIEKSLKEKNEYIFINAWNEWGEGNYLEPDTYYGYGYLKALKKALGKSYE